MISKLHRLASIRCNPRWTLLLFLAVVFYNPISTSAAGKKPAPVQTGWGGAEEAKARATKGKALFDEKCRTEAGARIYRTVPDIEGVVLLKLRPARGDRELADLS